MIPALNEAQTIGKVVTEIAKASNVSEIIVVDNGSSDDTASIANAAGAIVIPCQMRGIGYAMKAGVNKAKNNWIIKIDGDISNPSTHWISHITDSITDEIMLVTTWWENELDPMPVTNLLARPSLRKFHPSLAEIIMPLSGVYAFNRKTIDVSNRPNNWAFDISILIEASLKSNSIEQVFLGSLTDKLKPVSNYTEMAFELLDYLSSTISKENVQRYFFCLAHSDDAKIRCGGTIINLIAQGHEVHLMVPEIKEKKIDKAFSMKKCFPKINIQALDCKKDEEIDSRRNMEYISEKIKEIQPNVVVTNHESENNIISRSCYSLIYNALANASDFTYPNRFYMCGDYNNQLAQLSAFNPDIFVDITDTAELKYRFIELYETRNTERCLRTIKSIDDLYGFSSGVSRAEAFESHYRYKNSRATL